MNDIFKKKGRNLLTSMEIFFFSPSENQRE